ncbi:MAG TPA: hypothetical protein VFK52_08860 [Nocardioidaceae bacterium]|nr:hypothetical protein [Nocardioidaceae bacterium]
MIDRSRKTVRPSFAGVVLVVALGGCSQERQTAPVDTVYGTPESSRLELSISACHREPEAFVEESDHDVHLKVTVSEAGGSGGDCMDSLIVQLNEPVGDRKILVNDVAVELTQGQ